MLKTKNLFFLAQLFLCILLILTACGKDTQIPDVSDIKINLNINRFEKDLFALDTLQIEKAATALKNKYPAFADIYFKRVVPLDKPVEDNPFPANISSFINYPSIRTLYDTTMLVFPDMNAVSGDLEEAFQFYKYYFPKKEVPNIYTFISEYTYQSFIFPDKEKDAIGIGLDMFLGEDYPYRQYIPDNPSFSAYLTRAFNKEHLTKKVMDALIDDVVGPAKGNKLLDEMINNGKKAFIMDLLLPHAADSIKWEYTPDQLDWCQKNELQLWTHLLNEDLLYSAEGKKIRKLIDPSPQGPSNMPAEAPGRSANWIGYKIVKQYMLRHPELDIDGLIAQKDAQVILDKSRYRPR